MYIGQTAKHHHAVGMTACEEVVREERIKEREMGNRVLPSELVYEERRGK